MATGLFLLRLVVGLTLATHGAQKLFGWFGGPGLDATGVWMEGAGFRPGRHHAVAAGLAEIGGGILLGLGFMTPFAAAAVFSVMLVAAAALAKNGFFATNGGCEYPLVLGAAGLTLALTGPGSLSLDALLGFSVRGAVGGAGAAVLGAVGALIAVLSRRNTPVAAATSK